MHRHLDPEGFESFTIAREQDWMFHNITATKYSFNNKYQKITSFVKIEINLDAESRFMQGAEGITYLSWGMQSQAALIYFTAI